MQFISVVKRRNVPFLLLFITFQKCTGLLSFCPGFWARIPGVVPRYKSGRGARGLLTPFVPFCPPFVRTKGWGFLQFICVKKRVNIHFLPFFIIFQKCPGLLSFCPGFWHGSTPGQRIRRLVSRPRGRRPGIPAPDPVPARAWESRQPTLSGSLFRNPGGPRCLSSRAV